MRQMSELPKPPNVQAGGRATVPPWAAHPVVPLPPLPALDAAHPAGELMEQEARMQCTQLEAAPGNVMEANASCRGCCHGTSVCSCRPCNRAPAVPQIYLTYSTWLLPISIGFQVGRVLCRLGWLGCTQTWDSNVCTKQPARSQMFSVPSPPLPLPAPAPRQVSDLDWSWACIVDLVAGAFFAAELVLGFHTRQAGRGRRLVEGGACTLQRQSVASRSVASCWRQPCCGC